MHRSFLHWKILYRLLFGAGLIIFFPLTGKSAGQDSKPSVEILEPKNNLILRQGKPLFIQWKTSNIPSDFKNWFVDISIVTGYCDAGPSIHLATLSLQESNQLQWLPDIKELYWINDPNYGGKPAKVKICIHHEATESEGEYYAMWATCHAGFMEGAGNPACTLSPSILTLDNQTKGNN